MGNVYEASLSFAGREFPERLPEKDSDVVTSVGGVRPIKGQNFSAAVVNFASHLRKTLAILLWLLDRFRAACNLNSSADRKVWSGARTDQFSSTSPARSSKACLRNFAAS